MKQTLFVFAFVWIYGLGQSQPMTRIAFGSCSEETKEQPIWRDVIAAQPQLWIWLGDIIYADSEYQGKPKGAMKELYARQKSDAGYQKLLQTCPVIGVWDDHDYGVNDGGKFYSKKEESKNELLTFLDVPADDTMRSHQGVYSAHEYGQGDTKVKVILLDARSFRDTLYASSTSGIRYQINPTGDMLGEEQWRWLEAQLTHSDAAIHIIGTGVQFIATDQGYEKWANFPSARQRMIDLLAKTKPRNTMIISGDRHIAEISKMKIPGWRNELYDFTSSGLTHTWDDTREELNRHRVGPLIIQKNFGVIEIDWSSRQPAVSMKVLGNNGVTYSELTVHYR